MLATLADEPFDSPEFRYEVKWDGIRCLAFLESSTRLQSRRLNDLTARYPDLADLHLAAHDQPLVVDGEIVVLTAGRPDFATLLTRHQLTSPARLRAAALAHPVTYMAFDLLYWKGQNVMGHPLHRRRELLLETLRETGNLVLSRPVAERGVAFAEAVFARGLEGVMAKRADSPYLPGKRTRYWLKVKRPKTLFGVVTGYTERVDGGVGSVVAGVYDAAGRLRLAGQAGVSLPHAAARDLLARLTALPRPEFPLLPISPALGKQIHWVKPDLVCRLEYLEEGTCGHLRHAVFRELVPGDPSLCTASQLAESHPAGGM